MSLRDPKNPARWADGTARSQNNAFCTTYVFSNRVSMRGEAARQKISRLASQRVAANHEVGRDLSVGALKLKTVVFDRPADMKRKKASA